MTSIAFTAAIAADHLQDARDLLAAAQANPRGLAERAMAVGYHREQMWIQPETDGSARLIVHLETTAGLTWAALAPKLAAYKSEWAQSFNEKFASVIGGREAHFVPTEPAFSWTNLTTEESAQ